MGNREKVKFGVVYTSGEDGKGRQREQHRSGLKAQEIQTVPGDQEKAKFSKMLHV